MRAMSRMALIALAVVGCSGSGPVDSDPVDSDPGIDCAGLSEQTCGQLEGCAQIQGTRINGAEQYAGCAAESSDGCAEEPTAAEDPDDGACWDFDTACVPDGWTVLGGACLDA